MVPAVCGSALLAFDTSHAITSAQTARTIAALSILLIVTWGYEFGAIMSHFRQAAGHLVFYKILLCVSLIIRMYAALAAPSVILVFLVVVLFAVACRDAFNDEVRESCAVGRKTFYGSPCDRSQIQKREWLTLTP